MGQFAVIGLGAFGSNIVRRLFSNNHDVLAIDKNKDIVESIEDSCSQAILADATDRETLEAIGLENIDAGIICIGEDIAGSTLATLHLIELKVKRIVVKAVNRDHAKILEKIGASEIVDPERQMAERVADKLGSPNLIDIFSFGEDHSVAELISPSVLMGKTLAEANIRARYGVGVIAVKSAEEEKPVNMAPPADYRIKEGDVLVVIGENVDIAKFKSI